MERRKPVASVDKVTAPNKENKTTNKPSISMAATKTASGFKKATEDKKELEEEKKLEKPKTGLFTQKPSLKFSKVKTADPFSVGKKHKTNFGYVYSAGGIPCRINHGTVHHKI